MVPGILEYATDLQDEIKKIAEVFDEVFFLSSGKGKLNRYKLISILEEKNSGISQLVKMVSVDGFVAASDGQLQWKDGGDDLIRERSNRELADKYGLLECDLGRGHCTYASSDVETLMRNGKLAFEREQFDDAIALFSKGIMQIAMRYFWMTRRMLDCSSVISQVAVLFANRSGSFLSRGQSPLAMDDACLSIRLCLFTLQVRTDFF